MDVRHRSRGTPERDRLFRPYSQGARVPDPNRGRDRCETVSLTCPLLALTCSSGPAGPRRSCSALRIVSAKSLSFYRRREMPSGVCRRHPRSRASLESRPARCLARRQPGRGYRHPVQVSGQSPVPVDSRARSYGVPVGEMIVGIQIADRDRPGLRGISWRIVAHLDLGLEE